MRSRSQRRTLSRLPSRVVRPAVSRIGGDNGDKEQLQQTWPVFAAGTATSVTAGPLNLHVEPALWATVLTALPAGYMATVIAGPVEGEGIAWYQVVTPEGVEGWCDGSFLQSV